jgi:hypothetical protein
MITRGSLLIARSRKADNLTFSFPRSLNRAIFYFGTIGNHLQLAGSLEGLFSLLLDLVQDV